MLRENFQKESMRQEYTQQEQQRFAQAINLAEEQLRGQKRLAGEPFVEHNIRAGQIL